MIYDTTKTFRSLVDTPTLNRAVLVASVPSGQTITVTYLLSPTVTSVARVFDADVAEELAFPADISVRITPSNNTVKYRFVSPQDVTVS